MKRLARTKNSARNMLAGTINKIVSLLLPFLIRVVIIQILGKEYLGLNNLFSSILHVLNLAELGIGAAMVYSMYKPIAEEDDSQICALLLLYKKIYRVIGAIVLGLGIALVPFLHHFIRNGVEGINVTILYLIFLLNTVLSYWLYAYKSSLLIAHQRTDVSSNIGTIVHVFLNLTQVIILVIFKNYYLYILVKPAFTIANNLCINWATKRMYPQYKPFGEVSKNKQTEIYERVKALIGHKIGNTIVSSADSLVISSFLGLSILAIYSNYYYIIFFVISLSSIFFNGMLAGIGNSLVTECEEKNYDLFCNINFIVLWLVTWSSVCLLCLFQPFMEMWMGKDMLLSNDSLYLIVVYYFSWQFRITGLYFKDAAGMWKADRLKPYVSALFNLVVNILLVQAIGINGVFISTIVCMACINFPWETYVLFRDLFRKSPKDYIIKQSIGIFWALIICLITYCICIQLPIQHGIGCLILRIIICTVVPNTILFVVNYKTEGFAFAIRKIKQIIYREK